MIFLHITYIAFIILFEAETIKQKVAFNIIFSINKQILSICFLKILIFTP